MGTVGKISKWKLYFSSRTATGRLNLYFFDSKYQKISYSIEQAYRKALNLNYQYDDTPKDDKGFLREELFV